MPSYYYTDHPLGVSVYGSATIQTQPDLVQLDFSVSYESDIASEAYRECDILARHVRDYLQNIPELELTSTYNRVSQPLNFNRFDQREDQHKKYEAAVSFSTTIRDVSRLQEITLAIVDAGVNHLREPRFQNSRLKEVRSEARRMAIAYTHEKALLYCEAAGRTLGRLIHLEEINPDAFRYVNTGSVMRHSPDLDDIDDVSSGNILKISAAVWAVYSFAD
jgi:uncharacterized protein YggE